MLWPMFDEMSERIAGITLHRGDDPLAFFGLSFSCFNFGAEFYTGIVRVNFGFLLMIVRF